MYYAEFKKNAQISIYSLADLNIDHCVELTFDLKQLFNRTQRFLVCCDENDHTMCRFLGGNSQSIQP